MCNKIETVNLKWACVAVELRCRAVMEQYMW